MRCSDLINRIEELAPPAYACEWDNVGLLIGSSAGEVRKVFIALDATDKVIDEAVSFGADLLLTHHPLIFKPLRRLNDEDFIAGRVMKLIRHHISYYAMHTNFDAASGGMADLAAERLGLVECRVLEPTIVPYGFGKVGSLSSAMTLEALGTLIKERFGLPFLTVYGKDAIEGDIHLAAIAPGSGKSAIPYAVRAGAQVLITGDIGYHEGIDAAAEHLAIIDAGHYGLEHIYSDFMASYLKREFGEELEISRENPVFPAIMI